MENCEAASSQVAALRTRARLIAFYLPQFHPIPENDQWWGKGFTEWTNVALATPLFKKHYQPHLPADLGFYDLRLPEVREAQASMAREYGIEGFCYWHYWFNGKRLLDRPFDEVLKSGKPDIGFCLAWANETWSRRWLGEEKNILIRQTYSPEDDRTHGQWLLNAFADQRYIRMNGRPVFLIYRPTHLPDPKRTTDTIREISLKAGLNDPFLLGIDAHSPNVDFRPMGFDGTVRFEPQLGWLPGALSDSLSVGKLYRNLKVGLINPVLKIYDYRKARRHINKKLPRFPYYPSIFVGWDNTPRRGEKGVIIIKNNPKFFGEGLAELINGVQSKPYEDRLIFINAWNEWAEGNHLEPDKKHGLGFLKEVHRANRL